MTIEELDLINPGTISLGNTFMLPKFCSCGTCDFTSNINFTAFCKSMMLKAVIKSRASIL